MKTLEYEIRFVFTKDYVTKNRDYKKGTECNTLNGVVVLGKLGEILFDIDSNLARKYGKVVK